MKKFAFVSILAAACSLTGLAAGDTGCNAWAEDDGYDKACVIQSCVDHGYTAYFAHTSTKTGRQGIYHVIAYPDGGQSVAFQNAVLDPRGCEDNSNEDPTPNPT